MVDSTDRMDEGQLASAEAPASGRPSYAEIKDKLLCGGIREFLNAPPYRARLDEAYLALLDTVVE